MSAHSRCPCSKTHTNSSPMICNILQDWCSILEQSVLVLLQIFAYSWQVLISLTFELRHFLFSQHLFFQGHQIWSYHCRIGISLQNRQSPQLSLIQPCRTGATPFPFRSYSIHICVMHNAIDQITSTFSLLEGSSIWVLTLQVHPPTSPVPPFLLTESSNDIAGCKAETLTTH